MWDNMAARRAAAVRRPIAPARQRAVRVGRRAAQVRRQAGAIQRPAVAAPSRTFAAALAHRFLSTAEDSVRHCPERAESVAALARKSRHRTRARSKALQAAALYGWDAE